MEYGQKGRQTDTKKERKKRPREINTLHKNHTHTHLPTKRAPDPTHPQRPPDRRIAPQAPPTEHQVGRQGFPGRERREEQQRRHAQVVEQLEREDLREDAQGREGRQGVWGWGAPAWHVGDWGERGYAEGEGSVVDGVWFGLVWSGAWWEGGSAIEVVALLLDDVLAGLIGMAGRMVDDGFLGRSRW